MQSYRRQRSPGLPEQADRIALEVLVTGAQGHVLDHGLTDDQTIKGVAVMKRQGDERLKMVWFEEQGSEPFGRALLHEQIQ